MYPQRNILIVFILLLAAGCYKDKGNYDYKNVNDFNIRLSPESPTNDNRFVVNLPAVDTLNYKLTADVEQTVATDENNLRYEWIRTVNVEGSRSKVDTLTTKEIIIQFPPKKRSEHFLNLKITDLNTGIEFRQYATLKTKVPFTNSWLILHGEPGNRMVGAIEWDDLGKPIWTEDIYFTTLGQRRFQNAKQLMYTSTDYDLGIPEKLFIASNDSITYLHPFDSRQIISYEAMMAGLGSPKIATMGNNNLQMFMGFIDENGKYYNGRGSGYFYNTPAQPSATNYHADKMYIGRDGYTTLWDSRAMRFLWYNAGQNNYPRDGRRDNQSVTEQLDMIPESIVSANEMRNKTVLFSGRGTLSTNENENALFAVKDDAGVCYLYQFNYGYDYEGGTGDVISLQIDTLGKIGFNEKSSFATSSAYDGQLFYTKDNEIHLMKLHTKEDIVLYSASEGTLAKIDFRMINDFYLNPEYMNILGAIVQKANGQSEFHEIFLSRGGDVSDVKQYQFNFGPIVDFIFTNLQRRIL